MAQQHLMRCTEDKTVAEELKQANVEEEGEDGSNGVKILCLSLEQRRQRHRCQRTKIPQREGGKNLLISQLYTVKHSS